MSEPLCDVEEVELPFEYDEDGDVGSYVPIEGTS